jgi:hypothetical protein
MSMGQRAAAKCLKCGKKFAFDEGGGFVFHLLRCDQCGKIKSVGFDEIPDLHKQYLKGLPGPYCVATSEGDKRVQEEPTIKPISEKKYEKGVEEFAGRCRCGGFFRFNAPVRCPKCHSTEIEKGEPTVMYD